MVNPNVDSYAKTLNHRKIIRKTQKTTTYCKPNEYYNRNINSSGGPVFTFRLPGRVNSPLCHPSVVSLAVIYCFSIQ